MNSPTQDQALNGLTQQAALDRFGPAMETDEFDLKPELPEFRNELPELFDEQTRLSGETRIREFTWSLSTDKNRTIWFAPEGDNWVYVHHMDWDKGQEF